MLIIDLDNHNQLPDATLIGYILVSPEDAATEHARKYGPADTVYRVTRRGKVTLYILKDSIDVQ